MRRCSSHGAGHRFRGRRGGLRRRVGSLSSDRRTPQEDRAGFREQLLESPAMRRAWHQATEARAVADLSAAASEPLRVRPSRPRGDLLPEKGRAEAPAEDSRSRPARRGLSPQPRTARAPPWPSPWRSTPTHAHTHTHTHTHILTPTHAHTHTAPRSPRPGTARRTPLVPLPGAEARSREEEEQANMAARRAGPAGRA